MAQPSDLPPVHDPPTLRPTSLPPNPYDSTIPRETHWHEAYQECFNLEKASKAELEIMHSRFLGYLIIYAPIDKGRDYVSEEITRCLGERKDSLYDLAKDWVTHLFQVLRQERSKTPPLPEWDPDSRISGSGETYQTAPVTSTPTDHASAKAAALQRDGFKCLYSGSYDIQYIISLSERREPIPHIHVPASCTRSTHIFPSCVANARHDSDPTTWISRVSTQLKRYANIDIVNELNGTNIHRLENVLTLGLSQHVFFSTFTIWFEKDPDLAGDNHYIIQAWLPNFMINLPRRVTFINSHPSSNLALPDPRYLAFHASICRTARLSGVGDHLETYDREHEEKRVLASDGSSAAYLEMRLNSMTLSSKCGEENE
ncbi:hypothetical protein BKA70DRAFT_1571548 [Coprinopsis sp. MPI-PUGE-AT-0042]|nr:hypothetical protein BKA70DRAFT_1571548 [Coprinopsis sp. MPI-PUGE-AT-0042]